MIYLSNQIVCFRKENIFQKYLSYNTISSSCGGLRPFGPCWGSFGSKCGSLAPSPRIKSYLYTNIAVIGEITKIAVMPSILVKLA